MPVINVQDTEISKPLKNIILKKENYSGEYQESRYLEFHRQLRR